jgi:glutaredoxin-like protein NrdH
MRWGRGLHRITIFRKVISMSITVYSKSGFCGMCMATERALVSAGIEFNEVHLEDVDQAQIEEWKTTVGMNAPIVITDTETGSWSGFRPDKIDQLKTATSTVTAA